MSDTQITADALIDLRLNDPLAKGQRLTCPHDHLFWTAAGRDLAMMAKSVDANYAAFNIARYKWFTERLERAAAETSQIVILGAGFDSRAMVLPQLVAGKLDVFEVDFPDKIAAKRDVFARNKIALPAQLHHIGADLGNMSLPAKLAEAGYRPALPTTVIMEGVHFFLSRASAKAIVDPAFLGLAPNSNLVMDLWTPTRQRQLNAEVEKRIGRKLFGDSPLGNSMDEIAQTAQDVGYGDIEVISIDRLCNAYGIAVGRDGLPQSWLILEARVPAHS